MPGPKSQSSTSIMTPRLRSSATVAAMSATWRPKWLVPKWGAGSGEVLALPGAKDQDLDAPEPHRTGRHTVGVMTSDQLGADSFHQPALGSGDIRV